VHVHVSIYPFKNSQSGAALKSMGEKIWGIKGGSQEMAAMMLMLIMNVALLLKFININIVAVISWPPPLISQLFSHRLLKAAPIFHSLAVFE